MRTAFPACPAIFALAAALVYAPPTRAANLLVNGNFESPDIPANTVTGGQEVPGWTGVAFLFDGGANLTGWPGSGSSGSQYADFNNGPVEVYQDFAVPVGGAIREIRWSDGSSAYFGGGSYTVRLLALPAKTVVAEAVFPIPAALGGAVVPWHAQSLPLPPTPIGPGSYRLLFIGTGMTGLDYLVDDVVVEAGVAGSTVAAAGSSVAPAHFYGPGATAYLRREDSPFFGLTFNYFYLEDWEDGALNTPGVAVDAPGYTLSSNFGTALIDSVDADDGLVNGAADDGAGHYGNAAWSSGSFLFTFNAAALGALPTHAGIVWTDGYGLVRFEAFDAHGVSLGTCEGTSSDNAITGETGEDRFYGVTYGGGISAIRIWSPGGSAMEVDHLQYGRGPVAPGGAPLAYAANAGWLNARPSAALGLRVNPTTLAGWAYGANLGWVNFGDLLTASATAYANTSATNSGVNRDPAGNLSGYAYGANVGWINFGWATPTDPQRARTDLTTGRFLGYAYSANLGWIDLAAAGLAHDVVLFPDTDLDGLPDAWEDAQFGNLATASATTDYDGDGVTDLVEYQTGTDPRSVDSPVPARPSTIAPSASQLYAANAGWIDARPNARFGLKVGEYFLSGWLSAPNFGWINVGNGSPVNGHAYGNTPAAPADYGVNLDATGAFSGHAYGANIGWINFGWAEPNDPNRPRVDLVSGLFTGYVYSANIGWIALDSGALRTSVLERLDTDADGMDDAWERENFGTIGTAGVGTDADGDGQTDAAEYIAGTDPRNAADRFRIISQSMANGLVDVTLEFTSSETRRYRIEHTTQLTSGVWTDSPLGEFAPDTGVKTTRSFSLPSAATARFFRVKAVLPLATPAAP